MGQQRDSLAELLQLFHCLNMVFFWDQVACVQFLLNFPDSVFNSSSFLVL